MSHNVVVLDVAQPDFRQVKSYVKKNFGDIVWQQTNQQIKDKLTTIGLNPQAGRLIDELVSLGIDNFKFRLVGQTKIVYEILDTEVLVHMFIHSKQDFKTHLMKRLFEV